MDRLLKFGATFDWISPLIAVGGNIIHGPAHCLLIPADCGWTGREIVKLLRRNGVKSWGNMIVNDTLMINIRKSQAQWATYVLKRAGIPLDTPAEPEQVDRPSLVDWLLE